MMRPTASLPHQCWPICLQGEMEDLFRPGVARGGGGFGGSAVERGAEARSWSGGLWNPDRLFGAQAACDASHRRRLVLLPRGM